MPIIAWTELFELCHEWQWDGGSRASTMNPKQRLRTGFWSRKEWPEPGGVLQQIPLVIEVFSKIKRATEEREARR